MTSIFLKFSALICEGKNFILNFFSKKDIKSNMPIESKMLFSIKFFFSLTLKPFLEKYLINSFLIICLLLNFTKLYLFRYASKRFKPT